jgi:hypothetical protein
MKKGNLVKLDPNDPEISQILEWSDMVGKSYMASRPATSDEKQEWRNQKRQAIKEASDRGEETFDIAFDSGGEPTLPPQSVSVVLPVDDIYIVERARCQVSLGWGRPSGGMAKILNTRTGESAYVKRTMLKVVS